MALVPKLIATLLSALPTLALAQDHAFTPLPAPAERPYPYEILGMQPGDNLDDVMAVLASRSDADPSIESDIVAVQSPDGRSLEFTYERSRQIGSLTLNEIVAKVDFAEHLVAHLSSTVLEQRPVKINRSMRLPSDQLPTAQELQAQIEATYGPPSAVETSSGRVFLVYAWSDTGFIPDLENQPTREHTYTERNGRKVTAPIRPCHDRANGAYDGQSEYNFQYPRRLALMPGCIARFTVSHQTEPGTTTISFNLTDYDLARQHQAELDRQIIEALTSKQNVEPSNMDL